MGNLKKKKTNANNKVANSSVLKQHTNKLFLIEHHKSELDSTETAGFCTVQQNEKTPDVKFSQQFSDAVLLDPLDSIQIQDLVKSINEPMDGKFLLCRTICPPCKMTALMTVVDDPDGKLAVKIFLYNFVPTVSHLSNQEAYPYLPVGSIIAIMNPWLKTTAEGGVAVRCYNPSHVVRLNSSKFDHIVGNLTWKGLIPHEFQMNEPAVDKITASDWKRQGNDHFAAKRFRESIVAYTNGLNSEHSRSKLWLDLLSNRSAAHLKLRYYNLALVDAQSVLDVDERHIKCIFRRANALFGLAQFDEALSFLKNLSLDISKDNRITIDVLISKGQRFFAQSRTGVYPWKDVLANELSAYSHDLAEYKGPFVMKDSPNRGRGLFATETIKAGQLIMACRSFANVAHRTGGVVTLYKQCAELFKNPPPNQLVTAITQILTDCPEKCTEFYTLYGGSKYNNEKSSQHLRVDEKRIRDICNYNTFGYGGFRETVTDNGVSGIWILPSFINHSCVDANSVWVVNGDFIFVRAFHDIPKGDEILMCYLTPFESMAQKQLARYGFACDCRLCKRDGLDSPKTQAFRFALQCKLDKILTGGGVDKFDLDHREVAEVSTILNLLSESRADAPELNIFFLDRINNLALMYYGNRLFLKSASTLEQMFNITEDIAALYTFSLALITNIISSYCNFGDKNTASRWLEKLKEKSLLYYGSADAIETTEIDRMFEEMSLLCDSE